MEEMAIQAFQFHCGACGEEVIAYRERKPKFCLACTEFRSLSHSITRAKHCKGCGVRMPFSVYGRRYICDECTVLRERRNNGWADPYSKPVSYVAANDNAPQMKTCVSCECDLPLGDFAKHKTGGLGVTSVCRDCIATLRETAGRENEYARRNAKRFGADADAKRAATIKRQKIKLIEGWRAKALKKKRAEAKEVERASKPWLAFEQGPERERARRKHDPNFLLRERTRCRMRRAGVKGHALKAMRQALNSKHGNVRRKGLEGLLGFTIERLRLHLEAQFTDGMSWPEFRNGAIHIDHIRPLNTFDLTDPEQAALAWSLGNMRPLWAKDNMARPKDGRDVDWSAGPGEGDPIAIAA